MSSSMMVRSRAMTASLGWFPRPVRGSRVPYMGWGTGAMARRLGPAIGGTMRGEGDGNGERDGRAGGPVATCAVVPPMPDAVARDLAPPGAGRDRPVLRFAPSPNGRLHLGHAYSALVNRILADRTGGRFLVRIEDIDAARCTSGLERAALDDLAWLGAAPDDTPMRQSERHDAYREALDRLRARDLVYPAFLSRGEVRRRVNEKEAGGAAWPRDPDGAPRYPGEDRARAPGEVAAMVREGRPHALRLDTARALREVGSLRWREGRREVAADSLAWGDPQLARIEGGSFTPAYHLACTLDDAAQGITHVVRGRDLFHATSVHRLLQALLGLSAPIYRHHALVTAPDGTKLSKSRGDTSLAALREAGATREDVRAMLNLPAARGAQT